jgi:hypothetical protein
MVEVKVGTNIDLDYVYLPEPLIKGIDKSNGGDIGNFLIVHMVVQTTKPYVKYVLTNRDNTRTITCYEFQYGLILYYNWVENGTIVHTSESLKGLTMNTPRADHEKIKNIRMNPRTLRSRM